ncbi:Uncharacterised protein [uncultured archaeon]|nr:Uncharacterised protein [uncultured archaeon]
MTFTNVEIATHYWTVRGQFGKGQDAIFREGLMKRIAEWPTSIHEEFEQTGRVPEGILPRRGKNNREQREITSFLRTGRAPIVLDPPRAGYLESPGKSRDGRMLPVARMEQAHSQVVYGGERVCIKPEY